MPKVWLAYDAPGDEWEVVAGERPEWAEWAVEVEMNNSLYRQIKAAMKNYYKFQDHLARWAEEVGSGQRKRISNGG
jgi:hypothetical protein